MAFEMLTEILRSRRDVDWEEVDEGIVCNFHDGFDYVLLRHPPADLEGWIAEFLRTDGRRRRFIDGIRRSAKHGNVTLTISSNGEGHYQNGPISGEFDVSSSLTVLMKEHDVLEGLDEFRKSVCFQLRDECFGPDPGHLDDAASTEGESANQLEAGISTAFAAFALFDTGDLVKAAVDGDISGLLSKYPELQLATRLTQKYGERFETELLGPKFCIRFDHAGRFVLEPDALRAKLLRSCLDAVFEEVCGKYEQANRRRSECRRILFSHMAELGYYLDESEDVLNFGRLHREHSFNFEKEMERAGDDVRATVNSWLEQQGLHAALEPDANLQIETRPLPVAPPSGIRLLEEYDLVHIDAKAKGIMEQFWCAGPESPRRSWGNPLTYQPHKDTWMDRDWWQEQAKIHKDDFLRAVLGDVSAKDRIVALMKELADLDWSATFTIYEGYSAVVAFMAWQQAWPEEDPSAFYAFENGADDYWLSYFGTLPYEIKRYAQGGVRDALGDLDDTGLETIEKFLRVFNNDELERYFAPGEIGEIHRRCLEQAAGPFRKYAGEVSFLLIAYRLGWDDVVIALGNNESFWQLWETWPDSIVESGVFALALSLFDRDELTQRLAARTLLCDERNDQLNEVSEGIRYFLAETQMFAALAWSRTRKLF